MVLIKLNALYKNFIRINAIGLLKKEEVKAIKNFFLNFEQIEFNLYDEEKIIVKKDDINLKYVTANEYKTLIDLEFRNFGYRNLIYELVYISKKYYNDEEENKILKEEMNKKGIY